MGIYSLNLGDASLATFFLSWIYVKGSVMHRLILRGSVLLFIALVIHPAVLRAQAPGKEAALPGAGAGVELPGAEPAGIAPFHNGNVPGPNGIELSKRGLVVMQYLIGPSYFGFSSKVTDEEKVACYKREVDDMVKLHACAAAIDTFNIPDSRRRIRLLARAIQEYNQEHPGTNFAFFLLLDMPPSTPTAGNWLEKTPVVECFDEIRNSSYATVNGDYIIAAYRGDQLGASWWSDLGQMFKDKYGHTIFVYANFFCHLQPSPKELFGQLRDQGIHGAYYDFITGNDQMIDDLLARRQDLSSLDMDVASGINSAYWIACSDRGNSGTYREYNGYAWINRFFDRHLHDPQVAQFNHIWVTIWSDMGEDNFFSPVEVPPPFARNPKIPIWTHRGYYQLLQYYAQWWVLGAEPDVKTEALYWCYRQHSKDLPTAPGDQCAPDLIKGREKILQTWQQAVDAIFVTTRLKEPATLEVRLGGQVYHADCEAGIHQYQFDWGAHRGVPHFALLRAGKTVLEADGKLEITDTPHDYDGGFTRNMHQYADFAETSAP